MKKILAFVISAIIMVTPLMCVAAPEVTVCFNGNVMNFDVKPVIENDRILVPFRAIFEALGCTVNYYQDGEETSVVARRADSSLVLSTGSLVMFYNNREIELDVAPRIVSDRTLVPLRAVSEAFGTKVEWDGATYTAHVDTKKGDYSISSKAVSDNILAEDGTRLVDLCATYPVVDNPHNEEFINTINELSLEFAASFLYADETLEERAKEIYDVLGAEVLPMELSTSYTVDTNKNGILSITNHTCTELPYNWGYDKESIVWSMTEKRKLGLEDILIGDRETEINQTVYDAFVAYYEAELGDEFDAATANKLGEKLNDVRFYVTDSSLVLYFNPGDVVDNGFLIQKVEIPYSESFFKIKLDTPKKIVKPLPASVDLSGVNDCTLAVSLEKGDAYVDDTGKMQMKLDVYTYDMYDMVDIAGLEVGDYILRLGRTEEILSLERNEHGTVIINGGLDANGFELSTDESTVFFESGFNDAKSYYKLGEVTIPVSTEFVYTDMSELDKEPTVYYPGDFLTDDAGIEYYFSPSNTEATIADGYVVSMTRRYIP